MTKNSAAMSFDDILLEETRSSRPPLKVRAEIEILPERERDRIRETLVRGELPIAVVSRAINRMLRDAGGQRVSEAAVRNYRDFLIDGGS